MNTQTRANTFEQFISDSIGSREISIVITAEKEREAYISKLNENNFNFITEPTPELFSNSLLYAVLPNEPSKVWYDFLVQYPSGQIQFFDRENLSSDVVKVEYKGRSFVLISSVEVLQSWEKQGYSILDKVGLSFKERTRSF